MEYTVFYTDGESLITVESVEAEESFEAIMMVAEEDEVAEGQFDGKYYSLPREEVEGLTDSEIISRLE